MGVKGTEDTVTETVFIAVGKLKGNSLFKQPNMCCCVCWEMIFGGVNVYFFSSG